MKVIPYIDSIEIVFETPLEKSIMEKWTQCDIFGESLEDIGSVSSTGIRGVRISFTPKVNG